MDKFLVFVGKTFVVFGVLFLGAFLGGTFVWLLWPVAIPAAFPSLVASGALATKLTWWQSVCLTWLAGLLIKGSSTVTEKKE